MIDYLIDLCIIISRTLQFEKGVKDG
jgi:hypothetical protein